MERTRILPRRPRVVFLDVGWTLVYPQRSMWQVLSEIAGAEGLLLPAERVERSVRDLLLSGRETARQQVAQGTAVWSDSDTEFFAQFRNLTEMVLRGAGLEGDPEAWSRSFLERFWSAENWRLFEDVIPCLERMKARGLALGILSNAPSQLEVLLEIFGLRKFLDVLVISAVEGVRKPDRRIFERAAERAGVSPAEAVHVGDMYVEDVLGARAAGMTPFLIDRGSRSMFPTYPEARDIDDPECRIVRGLGELVEKIGVD
ncbi:MAG: hydrolase [Candidatus Binatia bacterium]|nr:MAG: hydrolase [Candidatus Binatia bacterium]